MMRLLVKNFLGIVLLIVAAGCTTQTQPLRVLWPVPPDQPRLEFIGAFSSELDFERRTRSTLGKLLVGENEPSSFKTPFGIATKGEDLVYVSDLHHRNVRVFDFKEKSVGFLAHPRQFQTPLDLAVDSEGLIYVADGPQSVVNVFSPQGVLEKRIGSEDLFLNPAYLAFNENLGRLYVSDSKGHKIVVFDMEGNHLFSFGEKGGVPGKFFSPQGLAIRQSDDTLFVADRMNARIQVFTKDGEFVRTFGSRGDRWYQFEAPKDLAFDSDENLYIVDQRRSFFYTYSPEGDVLLVTGGDPTSGSPLSFASPVSIHIDENDRIYIADMILKRFSVWQYLSESYLAAHPITEQDLQRLKEAHVEQIQSEKKAQ